MNKQGWLKSITKTNQAFHLAPLIIYLFTILFTVYDTFGFQFLSGGSLLYVKSGSLNFKL